MEKFAVTSVAPWFLMVTVKVTGWFTPGEGGSAVTLCTIRSGLWAGGIVGVGVGVLVGVGVSVGVGVLVGVLVGVRVGGIYIPASHVSATWPLTTVKVVVWPEPSASLSMASSVP